MINSLLADILHFLPLLVLLLLVLLTLGLNPVSKHRSLSIAPRPLTDSTERCLSKQAVQDSTSTNVLISTCIALVAVSLLIRNIYKNCNFLLLLSNLAC